MDQYSAEVDDWRRTNEDELRYRGRRFGFGLATAETRDLLRNFAYRWLYSRILATFRQALA